MLSRVSKVFSKAKKIVKWTVIAGFTVTAIGIYRKNQQENAVPPICVLTVTLDLLIDRLKVLSSANR